MANLNESYNVYKHILRSVDAISLCASIGSNIDRDLRALLDSIERYGTVRFQEGSDALKQKLDSQIAKSIRVDDLEDDDDDGDEVW